jgi:hypothetical protein
MQKHNRKFHGFTGRGRYFWEKPLRHIFSHPPKITPSKVWKAFSNRDIQKALNQSADISADLLSSSVAPAMASFGGPVGIAAAGTLSAGVQAYDKMYHRPYASAYSMNPKQISARFKPEWRR